MDQFGLSSETYNGEYSTEAYAKVVKERQDGTRLSRVATGGVLNPWMANISGGRVPMVNNQTMQHLPLNNPEPPQYMSGVEQDWADAVMDVRLNGEGEVVIIDRFPKYKLIPGVIDKSATEYIVWRDLSNNKLGITEVPAFFDYHLWSAAGLKKTALYENLSEGMIVGPQEVLAHSVGRTANGNYAFGRDLNWAWMGRASTNEDATEVSRRFTEVMTHTKYETFGFPIYGDEVLTNFHGDDNNYLGLPRPGDVIGEKGIVAVIRKNMRMFNLRNLRRSELRKVARPFDQPFTAIAGSRVVEVRVSRFHDGDFKYMAQDNTRILDAMAKSALHPYERILKIDSAERLNANSGDYPRHPSWHSMVVQAEKEMMAAGIKSDTVARRVPSALNSKESIIKAKATQGDKPYSYYVTIVVTKEHVPTLGDKHTNRHGAKSVIGKITEDKDMPCDQWGRFVDVAANPAGVSNRNNPSQTYEQYFNDASFHVLRRIREIKDWKEQWDVLMRYYGIVSIETAHTMAVTCTTDEEKKIHIQSCLDSRIDLISEAGDPTISSYGVHMCDNSEFKPPFGPVETVLRNGKRVMTLAPVRIAPVYTFLQDKIGKYASATNMAMRQFNGFVAKSQRREKSLSHISHAANRILGFTEVRSAAANGNPEDVAYAMSVINNADITTMRMEQLMENGTICDPVDLATVGSGRGLELLSHELEVFGHKLSTGGDSEDE